MFNSLTGVITGKFPQKIYIDTHGIEWDITVPDSCLDKLPPVGQIGKIYVWMQHTDSLMNLFGFASIEDRELFFNLLKVDGIGPKGAIKILGNVTTENLSQILEDGDVDTLQKIPGVGKKTAGKMLLQLKGKLSLQQNEVVITKSNSPYTDVINALVDMGYEKKNAETTVEKIASELAKDDTFIQKTPADKEDTIFRFAIKDLAK